MITLLDTIEDKKYKEWYNSMLDFEAEYKGKKITYADCKKLEDKFLEKHPDITDIFSIKNITDYTEIIDEGYTLADFCRMIMLGCKVNPMVYFLRIAKLPGMGEMNSIPFHMTLNVGTCAQLRLFSKYKTSTLLSNPRQSCSSNTLAHIAVYCDIFGGYTVDIIDRFDEKRSIFNKIYKRIYNTIPEFFKTEPNIKDQNITCVIVDDFEFLLGSKEITKLSKYKDREDVLFILSGTVNDNLPKEYTHLIDSMDTITDYTKVDTVGYVMSSKKSTCKKIPVIRIKINENEILNEQDLEWNKIVLDDPDVYRREIKRERTRKDNP